MSDLTLTVRRPEDAATLIRVGEILGSEGSDWDWEKLVDVIQAIILKIPDEKLPPPDDKELLVGVIKEKIEDFIGSAERWRAINANKIKRQEELAAFKEASKGKMFYSELFEATKAPRRPCLRELVSETSHICFDFYTPTSESVKNGSPEYHMLQIYDGDVLEADDCSPNVFTISGKRAQKVFGILLEICEQGNKSDVDDEITLSNR